MIGEPPELWYYVSLIALLLFSMFFSSGETAYLACNILKIKYLAKKNRKAVRVLEIIKEKKKFLITSLIGNSIVNILVGVVITSLTLRFSSANAVGIASFIATSLVLIFGEVIPKSVALVFPEQIAINYSFLESLLIKCFLPVSSIFLYITSIFMKLFNVKAGLKNYLITEDDLKTFFENSEEVTNLTFDEKQIMTQILKYDDAKVKNIMIPRTDIVAINIDSSIEEVINISKESSLSRFPVYKENIDDIKGILYIKDFIFSKEYDEYISNHEKSFDTLKIENFLRKPCFIFANKELTNVRKTLAKNGQNLAVVIDEYGGTLGIVTIEDLNEEIFGDIVDEYDDTSSSIYLQKYKDGYMLEGNTPLILLNEHFNINLSSQLNQTLAGFIMEVCGKLPEKGFKLEMEGIIFTVKKLDGNRIEKVFMKEI